VRVNAGRTSTTLESPANGKLRVLFLNDTSRNGGPGRTLFSILKHLDPARVYRAVVVPQEGVVAELLRDGGVADDLAIVPDFVENLVEPRDRPMARADFDAPLPLKAMRAATNVGRATRAMFRLASRLRRESFDVIFCNGTSANFAGAGLAAMTGVPAVWHVFYTHVAGVILPLHRSLAASDNVKSVVCVSKPTLRLFEHCPEKTKVVHDAIDLDDFAAHAVTPVLRNELGLADDCVVFMSQGRIVPRKGFAELIFAVEHATGQMSAVERSRCRVVIVGDTPEDMRPDHLAECRELVRARSLDDVVHFLGYRPDVRPYLADANVVVVPSIYDDPLPRSALEGMAFAVPIIAFARGGLPELIEHDATGLLVEGRPPDTQALGAALLRYLREPELRRRHGDAGRRRAEREFDSRPHAARIQSELFRAANRPDEGSRFSGAASL
jgi:glycosyltransferase involved in cell wall biosynthesis